MEGYNRGSSSSTDELYHVAVSDISESTEMSGQGVRDDRDDRVGLNRAAIHQRTLVSESESDMIDFAPLAISSPRPVEPMDESRPYYRPASEGQLQRPPPGFPPLPQQSYGASERTAAWVMAHGYVRGRGNTRAVPTVPTVPAVPVAPAVQAVPAVQIPARGYAQTPAPPPSLATSITSTLLPAVTPVWAPTQSPLPVTTPASASRMSVSNASEQELGDREWERYKDSFNTVSRFFTPYRVMIFS